MACYIISYDVQSGGNYEPLYSAIKSYGTWAHINLSVWAVVTTNSAVQLRDHLQKHMRQGDRLLVIRSGTEAAWLNAICNNEWLKEHL